MNYRLISHTIEKVGVQTLRELITIEVTYDDASKTTHGYVLQSDDIDFKSAAIRYATQLQSVITNPKSITVQTIPVLAQDSAINIP